jgi:2-polyprenyl-6-hydroxyphenyl methylase/3-demethylubiquinone-9 3-methyltransferase
MTRIIDDRELCHERLGDEFSTALSEYDTQRRLEVLVDGFLPTALIAGKRVLEVGCGLGFFSERLTKSGAIVTACDLGPNLVEAARERVGCEAVVADALALRQQFPAGSFDAVLSSECIEHTPDPLRAVDEMCAMIKPGGLLSLSTPNIVWWPVVKAATVARARPFNGFENFSSWRSLRKRIRANGLEIRKETGLHLFPFQLPLHGLSRWCDARLQFLRPAMINICILAQKPAEPRPNVAAS